MAHEQESRQEVQVTDIHVDLLERSITFGAKGETVASIRLASQGVIFATRPRTTEVSASVPSHPEASTEDKDKPKPTTLQGKLKSKPREGRPDSRGKPTAWARFAAHDESDDAAHMYSATFHRHTADIALSLEKDVPLTVQGYPHETDNPDSKRMGTLSVINVLDYPGKPQE
jgi:hypothetical protein